MRSLSKNLWSRWVCRLIEPYISCVGFSCIDFFEMGFRPSILTLNECIDAEYSVKIKDILRKYECGDTLRIVFFLSVLQGEVFKAEGYSFYMHSNERTIHNLPHIHVYRAGECPLTIDFLNLNIIEGEISGRKRRRIMKIISDKQELLIKHWNEKTNGITINVDYTLKYY